MAPLEDRKGSVVRLFWRVVMVLWRRLEACFLLVGGVLGADKKPGSQLA